jgi:hypothetical protein
MLLATSYDPEDIVCHVNQPTLFPFLKLNGILKCGEQYLPGPLTAISFSA